MAPIKLEDNMKERLEERKIEPTMAAWDRISSKLDAEQGVKKSKRVLWLSIAASFVGGALVTLFLFQNMSTDTAPVLVNENESPVFIDPTEEIKPRDTKEDKILQEVKETMVLEQKATKTEESIVKTNINTQSASAVKSNVTVQEKDTSVDQTTGIVYVEKEDFKTKDAIKNKSAFANLPRRQAGAETEIKEAIIAQVENPDAAINAEVEALLKNAQREIISTKTFNQKTNTVDANALLLDVEAEVAPTSFRNKIFEAVIDGFERTKDAVVNRNN
ncbi:hypothetical protein ACFO3O_03080 [Dokdonia ponticola]|uniref:Anti-sigma factor n=1 Tax=Dokdonia ponticola TaxID=2041041 RepID=A0ABV9HRR5_9FLAO